MTSWFDRRRLLGAWWVAGLAVATAAAYVATAAGQGGAQATPPFSDFRIEKPGAVHRITVADLPKPFATEAANNGPKVVPRPQGAVPQALAGYTVTQYVDGLENPRQIRTAPNGDLFVAETD